jgi:hypothetical protein
MCPHHAPNPGIIGDISTDQAIGAGNPEVIMPMNQLLGASLIFILCPLIGAVLVPPEPQKLRQSKAKPSPKRWWPQGGPIGGSAIDWSQWHWTLEILQGLMAVGIAKLVFPDHAEWDMIALMGVAAGRFLRHRSGGILMMLAGYTLHNPVSGMLVLLFGGIGSMVFRENRQIAFVWLMLMPLMTVVRDSRSGILIILTAGLAGILYGLEQKQSPTQAKATAQMFRADALSDRLNPAVAGELAVTLAQLQQQGFPVPIGWVIYPGDDPESLAQMIQPLDRQLWTVRLSFANRPSGEVMGDLVGLRSIWAAIVQGFEAHAGERVAAIVQPQINCLYSGSVYCQAPTLKADVPSPVSQQVIALVDRLNAELNTLETLEWGYDGQQVWILSVQ